MIQSITIKDIATYDSTGIEIVDLKKVNFIYGVNGSGKTTISNYLQQLDEHKFAKCSLSWKDGIPTALLVYNKNFRENNFSDNIKGVFTLGHATKEEIEIIDKKREELQQLKSDGVAKKTTIEKYKSFRT